MNPRRLLLVLLLLPLFALNALAQATPDPKQQLNEQLYEAVRKGDTAAVRTLLDKGADVNAKFRYGATALFKAAERGHTEIVKLLIERGADVSVKDTFYSATAMTWALDKGHAEVVRALLAKSPEGAADDVLAAGASGGNVALVKAAIERGGLKPETLTAALAAASSNEAATLQTYVGKYKNEQGTFEINVTVSKENRLVIQAQGQPALNMMSLDKTTFRPVDFGGIKIVFNPDAGKVNSFTLHQGPNPQTFKRVE
jgi:ankyrin repeat protein